MKLLRVGLVFIVAVCLANSLLARTTSALSVASPPPNLLTSPVLITGYMTEGGLLDFVQIYNNSSSLVSLEGWKIESTLTGVTDVAPIALHDWLLPHQHAVVARMGVVENADAEFTLQSDLVGLRMTGLQLVSPGTYEPYAVKDGTFTSGVRYELNTTSTGYSTTRVFHAAEAGAPLVGHGLHAVAADAPLRVVEILANARDCGPLEDAADCQEFIELYNPTGSPVDMSLYRLRFGYGNQTPGIANTVSLDGLLAAHARYAIKTRDDGKPLDITASGGNAWLEDAYGLKTYGETAIAYEDIGDSTYKGYSWALDDVTWKWAVPTPDVVNNFAVPDLSTEESTGLKSCAANQYRSLETHRCRNIAAVKSLTPCKPGQYRSAETNRCRNLATAANMLKACASNQYRSPETNRCRKLASAASQLKPCKAGQERNPDTNRCRNKTGSIPDAAFAVEPVKETGKAFAGWWALGGVGALALGYGVWEWRQEMLASIRKVSSFITGRK